MRQIYFNGCHSRITPYNFASLVRVTIDTWVDTKWYFLFNLFSTSVNCGANMNMIFIVLVPVNIEYHSNHPFFLPRSQTASGFVRSSSIMSLISKQSRTTSPSSFQSVKTNLHSSISFSIHASRIASGSIVSCVILSLHYKQ